MSNIPGSEGGQHPKLSAADDGHGPAGGGAEGLAADLPHLMTRRLMVAGLAMGGAALSLWAARGRAAVVTGTAADGSVCIGQPAATAGPFPADGSNMRDGQTVNILTEAGVIREDIRPSIGGLAPVAEGVPLQLEITLDDVNRACAPLAGHAVYLWQCDAAGVYSIYGATDRNYLRGVAISDAEGRLRLTTVFPGCYPGRWPHLHFEVFASADAAVSGGAALLTGQFALPEAECRAVYAEGGAYAASLPALEGVSLTRDGIFRRSSDEELAAQMLTLTGDARQGYRASGQVGLLV
jgi:protocatechuate 3,4-dioxygenase beta subunit